MEKEVLVLMELRARFDEENNINYSEILEEAGCKVMYGMEDYKVHSKVCLITKKNSREFITSHRSEQETTMKRQADFIQIFL